MAKRARTPKGMRLHIGLFGRRNVGKSSLLNAITRQSVSIVSSQAGTTTDPVEKPMELLPVGPVIFVDTAGIDDLGALGEKRVAKTRKVFNRTDVALIVTDEAGWGSFEKELAAELAEREVPVIPVLNKVDLYEETPPAKIGDSTPVKVCSLTAKGVEELRSAIVAVAPPDHMGPPTIVADLVGPGGLAVLVVPIDKEAPKGRLILPQVQAIRDLLDNDAACMVVKERELAASLGRLKDPPDLVVTDSQAFLKVNADTPPEVPMTSFSVLFARFKGDLGAMAEGAASIDHLKPGDRVLIAEACSHHPIGEDIGRVKIPRWLTQYVGGELQITTVQGHDFPEDISEYALVIHCGGCMLNRRSLTSRLRFSSMAGVPITNYGLAIAKSLGIIERALGPFPGALERYKGASKSK